MSEPRRRLCRAAFLALAIHLAAGLAMALVLARGLAANPDLADRLRYLDLHRWAWRGGWLVWNLAALSILYFYWAFAAAHRDDPLAERRLLRPAVPLAIAAVAADLAAEMIEMWLLPGLPAQELRTWDRRAVLLTGGIANSLYTTVAALLAWACRAAYPRWTGAAAGLVTMSGAALSAAAFLDSVPGMVGSNLLLVPALLAWLAGVGLGQEIAPALPPETPALVAAIKELTVEELVKQVLEKGWEIVYPASLAKVAGVPAGAKAKELIAQRVSSLDDMGRSVQVILDPASDPKDPKPLHLLFSAGRKSGRVQESFEFRARPSGELELALETRLRTDDKGRVVRGSGSPKRPDIKSPEVQESFRRELDFWLKGKGRKPPPSPPVAERAP